MQPKRSVRSPAGAGGNDAMMMLSQAARALGADLIGEDTVFTSVSSDTRTKNETGRLA